MNRVLALQKLQMQKDDNEFRLASSNSNTCSSESTGGCHITGTGVGDAA